VVGYGGIQGKCTGYFGAGTGDYGIRSATANVDLSNLFAGSLLEPPYGRVGRPSESRVRGYCVVFNFEMWSIYLSGALLAGARQQPARSSPLTAIFGVPRGGLARHSRVLVCPRHVARVGQCGMRCPSPMLRRVLRLR